MAIAFAVFTVSELWQFGTKRKQSAINSNKVHSHQCFNNLSVPKHPLSAPSASSPRSTATRCTVTSAPTTSLFLSTRYQHHAKYCTMNHSTVPRSLLCLAGCHRAVSSQAICCHHASPTACDAL